MTSGGCICLQQPLNYHKCPVHGSWVSQQSFACVHIPGVWEVLDASTQVRKCKHCQKVLESAAMPIPKITWNF